MVITLQSAILRRLIWAVPVVSLVSLTGCQDELVTGGSSNKVLVEAVANAAGNLSDFGALNEFTIGVDAPFLLTFDTDVDAKSTNGNLLFRHAPIDFSKDGYTDPGSLYVGKREKSWNGPLVQLPTLEPNRIYRVSVWVKLIENHESSKVSLMLNRVSAGMTTSFVLGQDTLQHDKWHRLKGEFVSAPEGSDSISTVHLNVENLESAYLIDDFRVAFTEATDGLEPIVPVVVEQKEPMYIKNGDAEEGMNFWSNQGGLISLSKLEAYSGEYSIFISSRTERWNAPVMTVSNLEDNKNYNIRIFTRLEQGTALAEMRLTARIVIDGQAIYVPIGHAMATDSEWVEVSGGFRSAKVSNADEVAVYLESASPTASYYVDNLTVKAAD